MKLDILQKYADLRAKLEKERQNLQDRLDAINAVLAGKSVDLESALADSTVKKKRGRPKGSPKVARKAAEVKKAGRRGPRKMSEEAKARIAAAARERWAKIRAQKSAGASGQQTDSAGQQSPSSPQ